MGMRISGVLLSVQILAPKGILYQVKMLSLYFSALVPNLKYFCIAINAEFTFGSLRDEITSGVLVI